MNNFSIVGKKYVIVEKTDKRKVASLKTWEQICHYIKRSPNLLPNTAMYDEKHRLHAIVDFKLTICAEVRNGGWIPDYSNPNQQKWYNRFIYDPSCGRFVFYSAHTNYGVTYTTVGARFCFETETEARSFAEDFGDLYNDLFILR